MYISINFVHIQPKRILGTILLLVKKKMLFEKCVIVYNKYTASMQKVHNIIVKRQQKLKY